MPTIKLQSVDGEIFNVDLLVARMSLRIKTIMEDLGMEEGEVGVIPLPEVNGNVLDKVIQWATHHKNDPPTAEDQNISEWDATFINVDQTMVFEIMQAAKYLDVKGLLDLCSKTVGSWIKGKTAEQIRQIINIQKDFTPAEEEQVKTENLWCEEK